MFCQWQTDKISHAASSGLLKALAPIHPNLPKDSRTLLKTPHEIPIKILDTGEYCHIGLHKMVEKILPFHPELGEVINISFNVDDLPLFKSSNVQFWPILLLIKYSNIGPFGIGIFCGNSKPAPLSDYLENLLEELENLCERFHINGKTYCLKIHSSICDAQPEPS